MLKGVERVLIKSVEFIAVLRAIVSVTKKLFPLVVIVVLIVLVTRIFG